MLFGIFKNRLERQLNCEDRGVVDKTYVPEEKCFLTNTCALCKTRLHIVLTNYQVTVPGLEHPQTRLLACPKCLDLKC